MAAIASSATVISCEPSPRSLVDERASQDLLDGLARQRLQHEHLRAREQRRVDFERGVLRGGADQHDVARFHAREERILLRLVEAVDLVDEDDRAAAGAAPPILRRRHDLLDLLDPRQHRTERNEMRLGQLRDNPGERGLAGAGRAPQDDRLKQVAFDRLAQRLAGTEDLVLTDDLIERSWTYALGERCPGRAGPEARDSRAARSSSSSANKEPSLNSQLPSSQLRTAYCLCLPPTSSGRVDENGTGGGDVQGLYTSRHWN